MNTFITSKPINEPRDFEVKYDGQSPYNKARFLLSQSVMYHYILCGAQLLNLEVHPVGVGIKRTLYRLFNDLVYQTRQEDPRLREEIKQIQPILDYFLSNWETTGSFTQEFLDLTVETLYGSQTDLSELSDIGTRHPGLVVPYLNYLRVQSYRINNHGIIPNECAYSYPSAMEYPLLLMVYENGITVSDWSSDHIFTLDPEILNNPELKGYPQLQWYVSVKHSEPTHVVLTELSMFGLIWNDPYIQRDHGSALYNILYNQRSIEGTCLTSNPTDKVIRTRKSYYTFGKHLVWDKSAIRALDAMFHYMETKYNARRTHQFKVIDGTLSHEGKINEVMSVACEAYSLFNSLNTPINFQWATKDDGLGDFAAAVADTPKEEEPKEDTPTKEDATEDASTEDTTADSEPAGDNDGAGNSTEETESAADSEPSGDTTDDQATEDTNDQQPEDQENNTHTTNGPMVTANDDNGIEIIFVDPNEENPDNVLAKLEIANRIDQILSDPPKGMASDKYALLSYIRRFLLFRLHLKSLRDLVTKVTNLQIKTKIREISNV